MIDLKNPHLLSVVADTIRTSIDDESEKLAPAKFNWRIAPSKIGDECIARLWYQWRWAAKFQVPGRIARLFQRGHGEEFKLVALLRATGWEVRDYAKRLCHDEATDTYIVLDWDDAIPSPFKDVSESRSHIEACARRDKWLHKQYRVKLFDGHLSGYLDGKVRHPEITINQWGVAEFKTYNTKRFVVLTQKKLKVADWEYYVQINVYMNEHQLDYCLFMATNKNDDDLYIEIIPFDKTVALSAIKTANTIIYSNARPARFAENRAHHVCKYCDFVDICHEGAPVNRNCRSCLESEPIAEGKFRCNKWNATIPDEKAMLAGCSEHRPIT